MKYVLLKIAKYPFFGRYMIKWKDTSTAIDGGMIQWKRHWIKSMSGGILSVWSTTAVADKQTTIVLGHPMGKEAKAYFLKRGYVRILRQAGYNVVLFDFNGFGESTCGNFDFDKDILAVGYLASQIFPNCALGYHGISLGAIWSIRAFTGPHPYNFAVVESAPTRIMEFWRHYKAIFPLAKLVDILLPRYSRSMQPIHRVNSCIGLQELLFVYSHEDIFTPVSMGENLRAKCAVPSTLWTSQHGKHAEIAKSSQRYEYFFTLLNFFKRHSELHRRYYQASQANTA